MRKPLFTQHDQQYLARFLGGEMPEPKTPFEARVFLERAAANCNPSDPDKRIVAAAFAVWADDLDPPTGFERQTLN